jgi:hypothetical protein
MKKILLLTTLLIAGCTLYTEKQSEALSKSVYATTDSLNAARVDLAYYYSQETTKLVKPPKKRIDIQPVYDVATVVKTVGDKTRVVIVPKQYRDDKIVVVGTLEYQKLLENTSIANQLKKDNENLQKTIKEVDDERMKQEEMRDKMIKDLRDMQTKLVKKDLVILRLWVLVGILTLIIAGYIYLKVNRLMF